MSIDTKEGEWIEWAGGESPVPLDSEPSVELRMGVRLRLTNNGHYKWVHHDHPCDIIAYRVVKS